MLVYNDDVTIDANKNELEMMKYCDSTACSGDDCPYVNMCDEFHLKYCTIPYGFRVEDGKPLTSL